MMTILKDNNGNHVVQKAIQVVPQESMPFLMDLFRGQVQGFATHAFGCRIIQRMLESGTVAEKEELMKEIYASTPTLITDQFGNYVAQHIIEKGDPKPKSYFIDYITAHLYEYSTHKFASNVVETCIKHGSAVERQTIINKLLTPEAGGGYLVDRIMLDQYGNYVIQHTVEKLRGEDKAHMVREIRLRFNDLKKSHTSRQMGAIERLLDKHEKLLNVEEAPAPPKANKRNPAELQLDVSSPSTTPALTMENSSPKSNNSASSDKGKDVSDMTIATGKMTIEPTTQLQVVTVDEDAN